MYEEVSPVTTCSRCSIHVGWNTILSFRFVSNLFNRDGQGSIEKFLDLSSANPRNCVFPALLPLFFITSLASQIEQPAGHMVGLGQCLLSEWWTSTGGGRVTFTSVQELPACQDCRLGLWSLCPEHQQGGQLWLKSSWRFGSSLEGGIDAFS